MCYIDDEFEIVNCFKEKVHVPVKIEVVAKVYIDDNTSKIERLQPLYTEVCCYDKETFLNNSKRITKQHFKRYRKENKNHYKRIQILTSRVMVKDDYKFEFEM